MVSPRPAAAAVPASNNPASRAMHLMVPIMSAVSRKSMTNHCLCCYVRNIRRPNCSKAESKAAHRGGMKTEAIVQSRVSALFQRMPLLAGFHVTHDMALVEIEFDHVPGFNPSEELYEEIADALLEALD